MGTEENDGVERRVRRRVWTSDKVVVTGSRMAWVIPDQLHDMMRKVDDEGKRLSITVSGSPAQALGA
jgi:fructose-1-phosphate kinase PfkB-like protein